MFKKTYKNLNLIEISKSALLDNFQYFQKLNPKNSVCPVLKSNAYGHGLTLIGKFVSDEINPEFICVDSLYEAYELRKSGAISPILILGYTFPQNYDVKKIDFSLPVFDIGTLKFLNKYQPGIKVHIKIDTGMNRLGLKENDYEEFSEELKKCANVIPEGIYSHLFDADNPDKSFTIKQIEDFKKAIKYFENEGFSFKYKHINATAGTINFNDEEFNLSRIGLGIYGISPFNNHSDKLKPALLFKSHIVEIKEVKKGEYISYGRNFKAEKQIKTAVLPVGYYEGIDRRLSNKGFVTIKDKYCPIIGNVCMNLTMIDISKVKNPYTGQEVIIFNNNYGSPNSIQKTASLINTIPYEILVKINNTIKRILI